MKGFINLLKCVICAMIAFIVSDLAVNNPTYNAEYIVKLLVVFSVYLIARGIYFEIEGK